MFGKIPLTSRYRLDKGLLIDVPRQGRTQMLTDSSTEHEIAVDHAELSDSPSSGDIYEQAFVKSITGRQRDFSKHLFGVIL